MRCGQFNSENLGRFCMYVYPKSSAKMRKYLIYILPRHTVSVSKQVRKDPFRSNAKPHCHFVCLTFVLTAGFRRPVDRCAANYVYSPMIRRAAKQWLKGDKRAAEKRQKKRRKS